MLYVDLEPLGEYIESVEVDLSLANDYHVELSEIDISGTAPNAARSNYRDRYRSRSLRPRPGSLPPHAVETVRTFGARAQRRQWVPPDVAVAAR